MLQKRFGLTSLLIVISGLFISASAQLWAPSPNWKAATEYLNTQEKQDSVFVFFAAQGNTPTLKAKFSDGSSADFTWYKYNTAIANPALRFEQFFQESGVTYSQQTNLAPGGYRVEVKLPDNTTEVYTAWVMVDDVAINYIDIDNTCAYLWMEAITLPNRYSIVYETFTYYDLSRPSHPDINNIGKAYFKSIRWSATEGGVTVPSASSLDVSIESPAPLVSSAYKVDITNLFDRSMSAQTASLPAIATLATLKVSVLDDKDEWKDAGDKPKGEAPMEIQLETTAKNADSVYVNILNDEYLFYKGGDSIVWHQASLFSEGLMFYPPKELLVPGIYPLEHVSVNVTSGCRDTLKMTVQVDTSFIKPDAIPNVFSPNGDGINDEFKIDEAATNVKSIKHFSASIYSRQGKLIYRYVGNPVAWEGWNGKVDGTKGDVPEGVYFYVIEAVGWDGKRYRSGKYKGFVHLYRGK